MSLDTRIFTKILVENQIIRNRTSQRIASRNLTSGLVPYLENEMVSLSKELTAGQTRANSPARRKKSLEPLLLAKDQIRYSSSRVRRQQPLDESNSRLRPVSMLQPIKLRNILEKCGKFHRPANCSLSNSQQFMDRQLHLIKKKVNVVRDFSMDDIAQSDLSGYEQLKQQRIERQQLRKFQVMNRVCLQNRKKLQKTLNKREKARAKFYTIT